MSIENHLRDSSALQVGQWLAALSLVGVVAPEGTSPFVHDGAIYFRTPRQWRKGGLVGKLRGCTFVGYVDDLIGSLGENNSLRPPDFDRSASGYADFKQMSEKFARIQDQCTTNSAYLAGVLRNKVGKLIRGNGYSMSICGAVPAKMKKTDTKAVLHGADVEGVFRCGSPHCPSCRIGGDAELRSWLNNSVFPEVSSRGWYVYFVTLTMSHSPDLSADNCLDLLLDARKKYYRRIGNNRFSRRGGVDVLDYTFTACGHHFHIHSIWIVDRCYSQDDINKIKLSWNSSLACFGVRGSSKSLMIRSIDINGGSGDWQRTVCYLASRGHVNSLSDRLPGSGLTFNDLLVIAGSQGAVADSAAALVARVLRAFHGSPVRKGHKKISTGRLAKTLGIVSLGASGIAARDEFRHRGLEQKNHATHATISWKDLRSICSLPKGRLVLGRLVERYGQRGVDRLVSVINRLLEMPLPPPFVRNHGGYS